MSPLALMKEGETAELVDVLSLFGKEHRHRHGHKHSDSHTGKVCCGQCNNCSCFNFTTGDHLMNMGLRPGKRVEMITNSGRGPLVLMVDESRIAMNRGEAMKIYVRRTGE